MRKLLTIFLSAFSFVCVSCGKLPDTNTCIVIAKKKELYCYNLKTDYNSDGTRKASAVAKIRYITSIDDLDKAMLIDPMVPAKNQGLTNFFQWISSLIDQNG